MSSVNETMTVNEDHEPGSEETKVLRVFDRERSKYGERRMTPQLIRERAEEMGEETSKQNVNFALRQLVAAGWVKKVSGGLYEFVEYPRQ